MDDKTLPIYSGSLSQEINSLAREIGTVKDGIGRIKHALIGTVALSTAARQVCASNNLVEEMDAMLSERDGRMRDLTRRIEKLEGHNPPTSGS